MNLSDLRPNEGATHRSKRIGRGIGSGHGKTCGRGTKGDRARGGVRPGFEGGQTPLHRRLPQRRGFTQPFKKEYATVNLRDLDAKFVSGDLVTPEVLAERGLIGGLKSDVKILGTGELTKKLTVHAHRFSKSAQEAITALGGTAEAL